MGIISFSECRCRDLRIVVLFLVLVYFFTDKDILSRRRLLRLCVELQNSVSFAIEVSTQEYNNLLMTVT